MAVKRNLAWMGLGQGFFFLLQFGGSVVMARLLAPYEMGVYAVAAALVGVLALVQSFGMNSFIVREPTLEAQEIATAFTINTLICAGLSVSILGVALFAGRLFSDAGVTRVLTILAFTPAIAIFELLPMANLERRGRFRLLMMVGMARNLTSTCVMVASALNGASYMSLAYGQVAGALVGALVLNVVGREFVGFSVSLVGWRRILGFGAHMLAISGVNSLATRASDLFLGRILGLSALGTFNRSVGVYRLFWDNLHLVIGRVLFVDLAQRKRSGESLRDSYLLICRVMTATLWPLFTGLAILSLPLFQVIYGPKWAGAALPFSLLAVAAVVQVSITMTWEIFTVSGETSRQARIEFIRTGIGFAMFAGACFISLTAAAASRVAEAVISMLIYRPHLERMTDTRLSDFLRIYGESGLLTTLAVTPSAGLMVLGRGGASTPMWEVAVAVAAGIALWGVGLVKMRHPLILEARRAVVRLRGA